MRTYPPLPTTTPSPLFSFAHTPITSRSRLNASLRATSWSTQPPSSVHPSQPSQPSHPSHAASTSTHRLDEDETEIDSRARLTKRARHRALRGLQPAGAALRIDAAELSDEENALEAEKEDLNHFGHRFLIPIGRRNTQMEAEAAPSPTPSDHDHRQEDRQGLSPSPEPIDDGVDLDASVEDHDGVDLDASVEDLDRSTEYDSDDLRLMREMDRSVGSGSGEDDSGELE